MADQMVSTVWNTASHPGHNLQKNLCELTSVNIIMPIMQLHQKITSGKRDSCGGFDINCKVTIRISIKYKKGCIF